MKTETFNLSSDWRLEREIGIGAREEHLFIFVLLAFWRRHHRQRLWRIIHQERRNPSPLLQQQPIPSLILPHNFQRLSQLSHTDNTKLCSWPLAQVRIAANVKRGRRGRRCRRDGWRVCGYRDGRV